MTKRILTGAFVALAVVLGASTAMANNTTRQGPAEVTEQADGLTYDFTDADSLLGEGMGTLGGVVKIRDHVVRRTLIRPRATFVKELLRTVEHL